MAKLTKEDVLKLARLARLSLSEEEVVKYQAELSEILEYVTMLEDVDTGDLKPTNQVTGLMNVMRKDELIDYKVSQEQLLKNAPAVENKLLKVKRMVG